MTKQNENPTKAMNIVLIGMTAGTLLLGAYNAGVNSGLIPTSNETKTQALLKQNEVTMKQMTVKMAQVNTMNAKKTADMVKETMTRVKNDTAQDNPAYTDGTYVYEKFEVSDIYEHDVNAEPLVGTGEGVHFTTDELFKYGLDSVFNGDVIEVGWKEKDYQENNWDKIAVVKKISSSESDLNAQN
jgi:hypothetical protein